jgi:hypothetical protein
MSSWKEAMEISLCHYEPKDPKSQPVTYAKSTYISLLNPIVSAMAGVTVDLECRALWALQVGLRNAGLPARNTINTAVMKRKSTTYLQTLYSRRKSQGSTHVS